MDGMHIFLIVLVVLLLVLSITQLVLTANVNSNVNQIKTDLGVLAAIGSSTGV